MNKKLLSLLFFFISSHSFIFGQKSNTKDSTAIISYVDKIIVKANFSNESDAYVLTSAGNPDFRLSTEYNYKLFLSFDYEFIGLSIGVSPDFLIQDDVNNLKGESSFEEFKFRFFLKNWTQELQYKNVAGYYVENTGDYISGWTEGVDPYIQYPGLKTTFYGGSTSYVLNPNFSLRNVVYNTEWQLKSAGSFIPTLSYGYSNFSAEIDGLNSEEQLYDISLAPSYYYTVVIHRNWFIASYLSPALGVRFSKFREEGVEGASKNTFWPVSLGGGLQLGYSSHRFIFGTNLDFEATYYDEDQQTSITNERAYFKIYFGYRLDAPKFISKPFNWFNKQLGL